MKRRAFSKSLTPPFTRQRVMYFTTHLSMNGSLFAWMYSTGWIAKSL